jgi:cyclopropane fatty-acyl-phospholipid synthase-like methyltransferase
MGVIARLAHYATGLFLRYGPSGLKKFFWDQEFSSGKWTFADDTSGDVVYQHLEKHVGGGSVLDLGCGQGSTAVELASPYERYVGVDISGVALKRARAKVVNAGLTSRAFFACTDFLGYNPDEKFDVILFRESMYHVPIGQVKTILDRYSQFLTADGVFIVRLYLSGTKGKKRYRPRAVIRIIESAFDVIERADYEDIYATTVTVFRPRLTAVKTQLEFAGEGTARSAGAS